MTLLGGTEMDYLSDEIFHPLLQYTRYIESPIGSWRWKAGLYICCISSDIVRNFLGHTLSAKVVDIPYDYYNRLLEMNESYYYKVLFRWILIGRNQQWCSYSSWVFFTMVLDWWGLIEILTQHILEYNVCSERSFSSRLELHAPYYKFLLIA